jgi:hypothetical protein
MQKLLTSTRPGVRLFDNGIRTCRTIANDGSPELQVSLVGFDIRHDNFFNLRTALGYTGLKNTALMFSSRVAQ